MEYYNNQKEENVTLLDHNLSGYFQKENTIVINDLVCDTVELRYKNVVESNSCTFKR